MVEERQLCCRLSVIFLSISATMSSVQHLRDFISARLTAAAEEIFCEFEKTIVQYEEEIHRQRSLLDISWEPEITPHETGGSQQHFCKQEEIPADQELYNQEKSSSLGRENLLHIKEEQEDEEEEEEQLKLEHDSVLLSINQQSHVSQEEPNTHQLWRTLHGSRDHIELATIRDKEMEPKKTQPRNRHNDDFVVSEGQFDWDASLVSVCGKPSWNETTVELHDGINTNAKLEARQPFRTLTRESSTSISQARIQTDENVHPSKKSVSANNIQLSHDAKPFSCKVCGKAFSTQGNVLVHMRVHSGERMYSCKTCGKGFTQQGNLLRHIRTHTGERPFTCGTCGKKFSQGAHLFTHMRIHTGEKPYSCGTCGKGFTRRGSLKIHLKVHTSEK